MEFGNRLLVLGNRISELDKMNNLLKSELVIYSSVR